ncbi:MAG: hypothetical protein RRA35_10455, partial [Desulfomonilia bacterium]|nr:hypothetical protein [Desulfomonilia bacterium]
VARHAEASEVTVVIQEELDSLSMTVQDNGKGISKNQIDNPRTYGLMGIRERAYFCGGTVVITGEAGKGTILNVSIPTMEQRTADDTSTGSR